MIYHTLNVNYLCIFKVEPDQVVIGTFNITYLHLIIKLSYETIQDAVHIMYIDTRESSYVIVASLHHSDWQHRYIGNIDDINTMNAACILRKIQTIYVSGIAITGALMTSNDKMDGEHPHLIVSRLSLEPFCCDVVIIWPSHQEGYASRRHVFQRHPNIQPPSVGSNRHRSQEEHRAALLRERDIDTTI